jgi:hypothetical protein
MNKLRNELLLMKIQLNSYYGLNKNLIQFQNEYSDKKKKFYKVQNRVLKVKRIYG